MKITIPLGRYGLEFADIVREKFNEQRNKNPERSPSRLNAYIGFRGRGYRHKTNSFRQDLPPKYAQYVNLYLYVDISKYIKQAIDNAIESKLSYIKEWYTEQTGGGCMVDFLIRNDGKLIGVTDECVVVYKNIDAFWNQDEEIGSIYTYQEPKCVDQKCPLCKQKRMV